MTRPTLLIPITFPDPELYPVTENYVDALDGFDIVLLGYWEIASDDTEPAVRRPQQTAAEAVLYEVAAQFSHAGAATDIELHFGAGGTEKYELQERILAERDPDGVLRADTLETWNNILLPLRDDRHGEKIVEILTGFDTDGIYVVELYHAAADPGAVEAAETMLGRVEDSLYDCGFSESDLEVTVEVVEDVSEGIAEKSRGHNIVVVGETAEATPENRVFGSISNYLVDKTETPILIVR